MKLVSLGDHDKKVRVLSHDASEVVKKVDGKNDLIKRINKTEVFKPVWEEVDKTMDPESFIGRCPEQVVRYCGEEGNIQQALAPVHEAHRERKSN